jgi:hypothetical protein
MAQPFPVRPTRPRANCEPCPDTPRSTRRSPSSSRLLGFVIPLDNTVDKCYTVNMSNSHLVRVAITDREWIDVQAAALYSGVSTPQLLGRLVRDFLRDPKRSPIVRRRQPARRPVVKR